MDRDIHLVNVFTAEGRGGNLAPIVLDATGLKDSEMRDVARRYERESVFVFPAEEGSGADFSLRFFVPGHEMEMCGHATVGTGWIMHRLGLVTETETEIKFMTKSGLVSTRRDRVANANTTGEMVSVSVSQPKGTLEDVQDERLIAQILSVLRVDSSHLGPWAIQNACTSRVKTVIPLKSAATLNSLDPDFEKVKDLCDQLGSTGLYPYAVVQHGNGLGPTKIEARQFPRASGYPEDAATGIAAAALSRALATNGLARSGESVVVYQGRAMGHLSQINVLVEDTGCWIGGTCAMA
ncbi:hypothetical protein A1O3_03777 [Capronia epimyces CBS 606.96]|uniref:Phenazine biosynthesis protein n=1 Tax=Capronia epimyces CBS 606.96 TaxID=1182542 RepID=W9Y2U5_9EURO|nr:uncharacterized protein A1O3_03777 [Capronia epimyces CBS 606.96]EXJ86823.1 hypothetical protein A1O3_03777 [Capronia epimyces CBS 606.96]